MIFVLAGLGGCAGVFHATASVPPGLDAYQTAVARRVTERNPEHRYDGTLPAMLPAVVVLKVTVDRDGEMTQVAVQRARDDAAASVAVDSMWRSAPLPPPQGLAPSGKLTFLETFLFVDGQRYQLRSVAERQASE